MSIVNLTELTFFEAYPFLKSHIEFHSKGLAIWHGLPDIRHIEVNYDTCSAILELKIFRAYPYLKSHILSYNNGLAIWHGLTDIRYIKVKYGR